MDSRVPATIALHLAKAELKVAELERLEQSTPSLRSNSNQRIAIARKLKAARELAQSWLVVVSLVAADQFAEGEEQDALDKEFKIAAAPGRCSSCPHGSHSHLARCLVMTGEGQPDGRARACGCTS